MRPVSDNTGRIRGKNGQPARRWGNPACDTQAASNKMNAAGYTCTSS